MSDRPVISFTLAAALIASQAGAIVVRHDLGPEAYLAEDSRFPALFALYRTAKGHRDCVATVIAPGWAVTAAHCTEDPALVTALEADGFGVEIGGGRAVIDRVVRHPGDESGPARDLALLRFRAPVAVAAVPLYRAGDELGRTVLLPGWGGTGDGIAGLAPEDGAFRVAENRIDAARDGWLIWQFEDPRSGTRRALAMEGISGPGDSGGPALIMTPQGLAIAGVGSAQRTYGRAEGLYGADEYFVRISDLVPWIEATMAAAVEAPVEAPTGADP